jgi:hypothetical protein
MQKLRNWIAKFKKVKTKNSSTVKDDSVFKEFGCLTEGLAKHLLALNQRGIHEEDRKVYVGLVVYELHMIFEKFMLQDILDTGGRPLLPSE